MPIGMLTMKIHRQDTQVTIRPPIGGQKAARAVSAEHHEAADRHQHGAAHALQHTGEIELQDVLAHGANHRSDQEDNDRRLEDGARSETIRHPATDGNEHREAQNVERDRAAEANRIFVE